MSRFNFCDCPAGFSASPERHAPDCPGRSGAGKPHISEPVTIAIGSLSEAEKQIVMMLSEVWNKYLELPNEHISDNPEFCAGIHRLQEKVLARPARRELNK